MIRSKRGREREIGREREVIIKGFYDKKKNNLTFCEKITNLAFHIKVT